MSRLNCADYKLGLITLKYIPVMMFIIMWVHTGLLILNVSGPFADTIAGSAIIPSILILAMSQMFKFCYIHKILTLYSLSIDLCINYHRYIGFGSLLQLSRIFMFVVGTIIFILLLVKFNNYRKKCCVIKEQLLS